MTDVNMVRVDSLGLADVIKLGEGEYMTGTVFQIRDEIVSLWRPYVTTADFTCTSGVIPHIGIETVKLWIGDTRMVEILKKGEKLK